MFKKAPTPSLALVDVRSKEDIEKENRERLVKANVSAAHRVTDDEANEQEAGRLKREKALQKTKAKERQELRESVLGPSTDKEKKKRGRPKKASESKPKEKASKEKKETAPKEADLSPTEQIYEAVRQNRMSRLEASIRLAFIAGKAPKGLELGDAISQFRVLNDRRLYKAPEWVTIPADLPYPVSGVISPEVKRITHNPLAVSLREDIKAGKISVDQARSLLVATTKDVKEGDRLVSKSVLREEVCFQLPEQLIRANLVSEEKEPTQIVEVKFTSLRRLGTEAKGKQKETLDQYDSRVLAAIKAAFYGYIEEFSYTPKGYLSLAIQRLGWSPEKAFETWCETGELPTGVILPDHQETVTGIKSGPAPQMVSWAVRFLSESSDNLSVSFGSGGVVLTLYYNHPTSDPEVRAVLGPKPKDGGKGVAVKRVWIGPTKEESASLRAKIKGDEAVALGIRVGSKRFPKGTNLNISQWPSLLKPGQYVLPEVVEVSVLDSSGNPTGEKEPWPALVLYQVVTSYTADAKMRQEEVIASKRGEKLPSVERINSPTGKGAGPVRRREDYARDNKTWQKPFRTTHFHVSGG